MIKKRDIVQILLISMVLLFVGGGLIYYSKATQNGHTSTTIGSSIDKFLVSAKGELNDQRKEQILIIKDIGVANEEATVSLFKAMNSLGWFLICVGTILLSISYSLHQVNRRIVTQNE